MVIVAPTVSIAESISLLDRAGIGALLLCADGRQFCGILTDGDLRRAVLKSKELGDPCQSIATSNPIVVAPGASRLQALHVMNQHDINHLPVVNAEGVLEDLLLRRDLVGEDDVEADVREGLENVMIAPAASLADAIGRLEKAGTGALVLCSNDGTLRGLLTDGDIRRAILRHIPLEAACESIASRKPVSAPLETSAAQALRILNQHDVNHLPLIDGEGRVTRLLLRRDLVDSRRLKLSAVIMAGGYGKRLLPLTEQVPKPMLPVGDKPLLELTIQQLRRSGIRDISLTTHYLPDPIVNHFGDGTAFGVRLSYLKEDHPLGTAGGLKMLKQADKPFLVINGDILTGLPFREMLSFHRSHGALLTVGVRKYDLKVPFGVVDCEDVFITRLQEKPEFNLFVNAGIYLLEPSARDYLPDGQQFDMTDLIQTLLDEGKPVVSFPIMEYWLDVGRHEDYSQAQEDALNGKFE